MRLPWPSAHSARRQQPAALTLLLAGLVLGCGEPTDPGYTPIVFTDLAGRYELVSIAGQSLPVATPLSGPPRVLVLADTLWLRADTTYEERRVIQVIGPPATQTMYGRYYTSGPDAFLALEGAAPLRVRLVGARYMIGNSAGSEWSYARSCAGSECEVSAEAP